MNGLGRNKENNKENKNLVFTKETLGVVLVLFSTLCLICLITRESIFSVVGQAVNSFLFGCFGFFAYAVILYLIGLGVVLISGKSVDIPLKRKLLITFGFLVLALILHIATASQGEMSFGEYISHCYNMGQEGISSTSAGGIMTGILSYVICSLLTNVGSYVILGFSLAGIGFFLIKDWMNIEKKDQKQSRFRTSFVKDDDEQLDVQISGEKDYPVEDVDFSVSMGKQKLFVNNPQEFALKNKKEMQREQSSSGIKIDFSNGGLGVVTTPSSQQSQNAAQASLSDYKDKLAYIKTPSVIDMEKYNFSNQSSSQGQNNVSNYYSPNKSVNQAQSSTNVSDYVSNRAEDNQRPFSDLEKSDIPMIEHEEKEPSLSASSTEERARLFGERYFGMEESNANLDKIQADEQEYAPIEENKIQDTSEEKTTTSRIFDIPFIDETGEENIDSEPLEAQDIQEEVIDFKESELEKSESENLLNFSAEIANSDSPTESSITSNRRIRNIFLDEEKEQASSESIGFTSRVSADNNQSARRGLMFEDAHREEPIEEKKEKIVPPINREYFRPPFDLLETYAQPVNSAQENHQERMEIIQRTLEEFHINAIPQNFIQGPSITRYEIMMPAGISVKNVLKYDDDLKMRLSAKNGVRIEAPIPGKNLVGIEVANNVKVTVGLKEVMEGLANKKDKAGSLMFALGKDIVGNSISDDLTKGPHYLIAGATGSGKSVCLHVMLVSMLMRYSPEELKLVLVDPKSVEFRKYEHIPHLLVDEIITEPKRALALLQWAYEETNKRNEMFTSCGGHISNIDDYNSMIANDTIPKLPRIVFIIDELADLMEACKKDLEARIRMIAAKSRSAGIHLVLATQRPSVDVITGTIKANLPSRIALKVMNFADSQTILGEAGAEKLLGNGDMLYKNSSMGDYERYQGAYISGREIANVVEYIKEKNTAYFDDDVQEYLDKETKPKQEESSSSSSGRDDGRELDEFFLNALWTAVSIGTISISLLQRKFQIGYPRAGTLVDKMEKLGFISAYDGNKTRKVLLSKEEFINRFGPREESF